MQTSEPARTARRKLTAAVLSAIVATILTSCPLRADVDVLFLGDDGHHQPRERFDQAAPVLAGRGVHLAYTGDPDDLRPEILSEYDVLLLYANIDRIEPSQEEALLDFVAGGGGFVPVHCATYCFRNSDRIVELMGAQFHHHGTGVFRTEQATDRHPLLQGFEGFASWDETYVHHRHHETGRQVLAYRVDEEGREPWTWIKTHGHGRVFYTAWGHDHRTWGHPGFLNLLERGIRWAAGEEEPEVGAYADDRPFAVPRMTELPDSDDVFQYEDVGPGKIPNYVAGAAWGTTGDPIRLMQQPLAPEASRRRYVVPEGFELRLFASEEQFEGKPIAMNWDERGRLWIAETVDYPNELQPAGTGRDRIRICEDTDGDQVADRFVVFEEDLSIPTAITFYRGGVIVQNGTETLYLKDTDGDDRADVRRVLISNWTLGDTHGGVSNFHYGTDNWIWAMQGYNRSSPVINGESQPPFRMGFFRFRLSHEDPPRVLELEFVRSTNNNTWGLGFNEAGLVFGSTANGYPSWFMPLANRYYERVRGWTPELMAQDIADSSRFEPVTERVRQVDHHGRYTAAAGHAVYTARAYPRNWWNRTAFVCGPTGHLVGTFVLSPDGAGYRSTSPTNLLASDDEWSAPIMAEVGPDGCVWILDWYNYIVQHNPTPQGFSTGRGNAYESELRDKQHGRIYRLVYVGGEEPAGQARGGVGDEPAEWIAALRDPTLLRRLHAQRLLVERGDPAVAGSLVAMVDDRSTDSIGTNPGALHALATLHGLGLVTPVHTGVWNAVDSALSHPSWGVRLWAVRVLPPTPDAVPLLLRSGALSDVEPQVRLAAMLKLADLPPNDQAGHAVAEWARSGLYLHDRYLRDAVTAAAAAHPEAFLTRLARSDERTVSRATGVAQIVGEHLARGRPDARQWQLIVRTLQSMEEPLAHAVLTGMLRGWPDDHAVSQNAGSEGDVRELFANLAPRNQSLLVRLAQRAGSRGLEREVERLVISLLEEIADTEAEVEARVQAAREVVGFQPDSVDAARGLVDVMTPQASPELIDGLLEALAESTAEGLGTRLMERADELTPAGRNAVLRRLLSRPDWTVALLDAAESGRVRLDGFSLDQQRNLSNHPDAGIRERAQRLLARAGGLPDPDRARVIDELAPEVLQVGDIANGREVYKKHCAKCHVHGTEGERVGPDLTGMAVHPKEELLVHLLDPSRSVEGNFRLYTVVTADGLVLNGMLAGESRTSIELIDSEGRRVALPREDLDEIVASTRSVMPDGFEKQMTVREIADLLEFLTAKGRFLPVPLDRYATAVSTRSLFHEGGDGPDRMIFPDWQPRTFEGVPFVLVDPLDGSKPNMILLHGPQGTLPPEMPATVSLPCNSEAVAVHFLSGVSGWGYPAHRPESVSMIVRLHYGDGTTEDHPLRNGVHFADYIRRVDVPESAFAFQLRGRQLRYLSVQPQRRETIESIELVKGPDPTAPIVMAVTIERPEPDASSHE